MLLPMVLLVLSAAAMAADYEADFKAVNVDPSQIYLRTDIRLLTDFTLSTDASQVGPGADPNNLKSGDSICSGATVTLKPSVTSKWALSGFDMTAVYPSNCGQSGGPSCPIQYPGSAPTRDIRWISSSLLNEKKSFGQASFYDISQHAVDSYGSLGGSSAFPLVPASYSVNPSGGAFDFLPGKYQAGANVFCKGSLRISDGTTPYDYSMSAMPSQVQFDITGSGTKTLSTSLSGVDCIGMAVKKPEDINNTLQFYLYHYALSGPSFPSTTGTDSVSLNVQEGATACAMEHTSVRSMGISGDYIYLRVREKNTGPDPMTVTKAQVLDLSGDPDFSVVDYNQVSCTFMTFSPCPSSSGFGETIAPGASKDLYLFLKRKAGATDDSVAVILSGESEGLSCGGSGQCADLVSISGAVACDIEPPQLDMKPKELGEFHVSCQNLLGDQVACSGDDWFWWLMSGDFYEKDNSHAIAYPLSPAGSSGQLVYRTGITDCASQIELFDDVPGRDEYSCGFDPSSALMNTSATEHFDFDCLYGTDPAVPDTADYQLDNGLDGSLGNSDTSGTDFTSSGQPSDGDIDGFGFFTSSHPPYILGAMGQADVAVQEGSDGFCPDPPDPYDPDCPPVDCTLTPWHPLCNDGKCDEPPYVYNDPDCDNDTNNTNNNGEDDDGSSMWCTIGDASQSVIGSGTKMYLHIGCGQSGTEQCEPGIVWSIEPPNSGSVVSSGPSGASVVATAPLGTVIRVRAFINGDEAMSCSKYLEVDDPDCVELS